MRPDGYTLFLFPFCSIITLADLAQLDELGNSKGSRVLSIPAGTPWTSRGGAFLEAQPHRDPHQRRATHGFFRREGPPPCVPASRLRRRRRKLSIPCCVACHPQRPLHQSKEVSFAFRLTFSSLGWNRPTLTDRRMYELGVARDATAIPWWGEWSQRPRP